MINNYAMGPNQFNGAGFHGGRPHFSFTDAIKAFFKNYIKIDGRASRSELWWVILFTFIISSILSSMEVNSHGVSGWTYSTLNFLWELLIFIPMITLTARRLHDTNRSGWWQLLYFIPIIGWIPLLVFLVQGSNPEGARFDGPVQPWAPGSDMNNFNGSPFNR